MQSFIDKIPLCTNSSKVISQVIEPALAADGLYTGFDALLHALSSTDTSDIQMQSSWLQVVKIFAYGTCEDYLNIPNPPALACEHWLKLQQLSLVQCCSRADNRVTSYSELMMKLSIATVREFEMFVTQCIYSNLIKCRLDSRNQCLTRIKWTLGRDVDDNARFNMQKTTFRLIQQCTQVLENLKKRIDQLQQDHTQQRLRAQTYDAECKSAIAEANKTKETRSSSTNLDFPTQKDNNNNDTFGGIKSGFLNINSPSGSSQQPPRSQRQGQKSRRL